STCSALGPNADCPDGTKRTRARQFDYSDTDPARSDLVGAVHVLPTEDSHGLVTTFTYDSFGALGTVVATGGAGSVGTSANRTSYIYYDDAEHIYQKQVVVNVADALNLPNHQLVTDYVYDRSLGIPLMVRHPNGVIDFKQVDQLGRTVVSGRSGGD